MRSKSLSRSVFFLLPELIDSFCRGCLCMRFRHAFVKYYHNKSIFSPRVSSLPHETLLVEGKIHLCIEPFDFASEDGWDGFYTERHRNVLHDASIAVAFEESKEFEWHSSVPSKHIIDEIPFASSSCLVIGCGDSRLPRTLHDSRCLGLRPLAVTCLDFSQPCLDYLYKRDSQDCPDMSFVRGDATRLNEEFPQSKFDVIVDKGLMDALMCGDDWDAEVERLLKGVSSVLEDDGIYILVSYKLSSSTQDILRNAGQEYGLFWELDRSDKSTDSISFSVATRLRL